MQNTRKRLFVACKLVLPMPTIFFYVTFSNGTGMNRHCTQKRQEESMPILKVGIVDWSTSVLDLHNYFHEKVSTFNKS